MHNFRNSTDNNRNNPQFWEFDRRTTSEESLPFILYFTTMRVLHCLFLLLSCSFVDVSGSSRRRKGSSSKQGGSSKSSLRSYASRDDPSPSFGPTPMPAGFRYPPLEPSGYKRFKGSPTIDEPSNYDNTASAKGNKGSAPKSGISLGRHLHHRRDLIDISEEEPAPSLHSSDSKDGGRLRNRRSSNKESSEGSYSSLERKRLSESAQDMALAARAPIEHPIIEELKNVDTRYYLYDDCDILQCELLMALRESGPPNNKDLDHTSTDMRAEADIIKALRNHPLRTEDTLEASLYVVPLPISELIAYGCQWEDCKWFEESIEALSNHPLFQEHHGNNHVLISQHWVAFNSRFPVQFPAMALLYRKLTNVTVAMHFDPFGCAELANDPERSHGSGFSTLFQWEGAPLTRAFSVGLVGTTDLPFQAMTMEKFRRSEFLIFYHTRIVPFAFRSTKYRLVLVSNSTANGDGTTNSTIASRLPYHTSIGFDIPKIEWMENLLSSKFCLVIRGDTPHSHALLHSLRAGCIPVIVSDFYDEYAPSFKSTMSIKDWTIFIDEDTFLADPSGQIRALDELPLNFIEEKVANASLAQAIVLSESQYFVPAFLRESVDANLLAAPSSSKAGDDVGVARHRKSSFTFNGTLYQYRYPSLLLSPIDLFHEAPVIVGVISLLENCARRQMIRESWGKNRRVFFLLSGLDWNDVSEEFHLFGDILWMEDLASNSSSPALERMMLSRMFIYALEEHVESYSYMALTKDENYVDMDRIELILHVHQPAFWSGCVAGHKKEGGDNDRSGIILPSRLGYALSRKFNHCAVKKLDEEGSAAIDTDILDDDHSDQIFISSLADLCGFHCEHHGWDYSNENWTNVISNVATGREFFYLNEHLLWTKKMSPYYETIAVDTEAEEVEGGSTMMKMMVA